MMSGSKRGKGRKGHGGRRETNGGGESKSLLAHADLTAGDV